MTPPFWSDTFAVGHPDLDSHHRILIEELARIHGRLEDIEHTDLIVLELDRWLDAFSRHALIEEKLMERLTQPEGVIHRNAHVTEHADFLHQAAMVRARILDSHESDKAVEALGLLLVKFDLMKRDFEMIGLLMREGILNPGEVV